MPTSCRSAMIRCLVFGVVVLASSRAQTRAPIAEQLAKTYGLDSFGQIEAIRYTFNIQFPGLNLVHSWVWEPKTGRVTYEGKDKDGKPVKATYVRSQLNSAPANVKDEIEPAFVNDQYWLMLPFHVYQDSRVDVQDLGIQKLPLGKGSARRVAAKYTPGDTWELYVGRDNRVEEMVFHRGGPQKPSVVVVTWEGYQKAGPLLISTDHHGTADGKPLRLYFSNVSARLTGSDKWVNAQ